MMQQDDLRNGESRLNASQKTAQMGQWELDLVSKMKDPIFICSSDYRIEYMNPAMIKRTGHDATGEHCFKAIHDLDEKCPWCCHEKILSKEHVELDVVSPKDNRSFLVSYAPIVHEDGSVSKLIVFKDTTELKALEAQLQQAQKMEAIGTLAGGVAHDFNNILTTIIGNAQLALMEVDTDGPLREELEEIQAAGEKAAELTRQLQAFRHKQVVRPEILDLNELLAGIEKMLGRLIGEHVEILIIPEPELWQVEADPGQMEQVIMNLAVNAKDAMPKGGKFTIETANMILDENYFRHHGIKAGQPGPYVVLTISDIGIGMDKETRERIFEPFFTTKETGTGLGLPIVSGIVKQNNGFIWPHSDPLEGSTFQILLPRAEGGAELEEKERASADEAGGSETLLLVEDDDRLRKLMQTILKQRGYQVLSAENGEDALRVSETHDGLIDLLVTDIVMPKISGQEVTERLQLRYPHIKVIYMSGYTDNTVVNHGVLASGRNFIEKPFTPERLARKVRKILNVE